jgi:ATP-dependent DNA helicase RecQ
LSVTVNTDEEMNFDLSVMHGTLKSVFGFADFRELQKPIVKSIMDGKHTLAILKTSGGKSLCYQMPAIHRGGLTLVISPLISLMKDQVDGLEARNIPSSFVNSSLTPEEMRERYLKLATGQYTLFYVSPERFQDENFLQSLMRAPLHTVAIDEAHCASQWGHDFRPNYSRLGENLDLLETRLRKSIQRIAFTATATARVQEDIIKMLRLNKPDIHIQDFDRENLSYAVVMSRKSDRTDDILQALEEHPDDCTIIYCVTVKEVERLYGRLKDSGIDVDRYHGRLEKEEKTRVQDEFIQGRIRVLISTSAFGMGVDKADVRLVLHAQMPGSLEAWYQEAGRGGRDGNPAKAILFYHESDKSIHRFFIGASSPDILKINPIKDMIYKMLAHGPAGLDPQRIARNCTHQLAVINAVIPDNGLPVTEISRNDVQATINLLRNQGEIDEYDTMFTLGNWEDNKEYIWVDEVKRHNWLKFNAMCSWCETNLCRRWQILRYFDERKAHYRCGNCDNCQREAIAQTSTKGIEKAVRPSTLMAMANALSIIDTKDTSRWIHVLIGTLPVCELSEKETEVSGRFAYHAIGDLRRWRTTLISNEMVDENHALTQKGQDWIAGKLQMPVKSPTFEPEQKAFFLSPQLQVARVKALRSWRKAAAYRDDAPEITIATEAQLKKISELEFINPDSLSGAGFSARWISSYGAAIVKSTLPLEETAAHEI